MEKLSGYVQGKKASDLEERTAIAISKLDIPYTFQMRISPLMGLTTKKNNLPGEVEVDFLCEYLNTLYPINIQGEIAHFYAAWTKDRDAEKKIIIDDTFRPYNAHELIQVPFWKLKTQEDADRLYRQGFLASFPAAYYEE